MAVAKATNAYRAAEDRHVLYPDEQAVIDAALDEADAQSHEGDVPLDAAIARLKSIVRGEAL